VLQILSSGIYNIHIKCQAYRTSSAAVAKIQFYARLGASLPLTRANDIDGLCISRSIDLNTERTSITSSVAIVVPANQYLSFMMIGENPAGVLGIEAAPGIVETGGFATPAYSSCRVTITKIR
jgi:hypothetical protein